MRATWKPHTKHGDLTGRADLPDSVFAYPKKRKEPMTDASHVRNAIARFDQVTGVTAAERELAFANIQKAAKHYKVDMTESKAEDLGTRPSTGRTVADRKKSAKKAAATRKRKATGGAKTAATRKKATRKRSG
jgi:cell division protein FtsX